MNSMSIHGQILDVQYLEYSWKYPRGCQEIGTLREQVKFHSFLETAKKQVRFAGVKPDPQG